LKSFASARWLVKGRLTDFQTALGSSQLLRAYEGLEKRGVIVQNYNAAFQNKSHIKGQI
jgi:dTDP-4-amino-4,6-dideoxygalactose transaminase